ncbi:TPA: hypothetical protein N2826_004008 [Vibrio parahaemolyticus]|uniref:hypothetical protein n=1 Tax=Vibrio parahaemolyticus TaxID=670 RepID=UPI00112093BB|nr:hypothetical protein [Vibrio parahaemolyticus]MBE4286475.1 hypothetical protein [Vibrio parahaemolyticus]TOH19110.1 hypothetical protein CGI90_03795 [Vibrio parahaemolyticus]HCG8859855.1 hypothetical protein [Vibrio parahaemolyticus]HCM0798046.1 hypothetical protein [Vibrio parahaemolyticus]HCM0883523.1 hypothetical protein [Vibrio parahaemolyticus]
MNKRTIATKYVEARFSSQITAEQACELLNRRIKATVDSEVFVSVSDEIRAETLVCQITAAELVNGHFMCHANMLDTTAGKAYCELPFYISLVFYGKNGQPETFKFHNALARAVPATQDTVDCACDELGSTCCVCEDDS